MKGIVLSGGRATRLSPASNAVCKQLMLVYDKPLVYYPISTLIHARINEMLFITNPQNVDRFRDLLGDGSAWGCSFEFMSQENPQGGIAEALLLGEDFVANEPVALILGDNIFYGVGLGEQLQNYTEPKGAVVFGYWVPNPESFGVLEFGAGGEVVAIHEKPAAAPSNYMVPGLYFYDNSVVDVAKSLARSPRGELEITDVNNVYLREGRLEICKLPFAVEWFDAGTFGAMLEIQNWVAGLQHRRGVPIGSPEAAAYREGFISPEQLRDLAESEALTKSGYGEYLLRALREGP